MTNRPSTHELARIIAALEKVGEFWCAFDVPLPRIWDDSSAETRSLYATLIAEEFGELLDAKSRVDRLDAICDLQYVALGGLLSCGFRGDLLKTHGWNRPLQKAVGDAVTRLRANPPCQQGCKSDVPSLVVTMQRFGEAAYKRFNDAFGAVHANNMKKLWETPPDDASLTVKQKYVGQDVRYLVRRASDGKIIKPPNHTKVDLQEYI